MLNEKINLCTSTDWENSGPQEVKIRQKFKREEITEKWGQKHGCFSQDHTTSKEGAKAHSLGQLRGEK